MIYDYKGGCYATHHFNSQIGHYYSAITTLGEFISSAEGNLNTGRIMSEFNYG